MRAPSIRLRIALWFVALSGILLATFSITLHALVGRSARQALDATLAARAVATASLVEFDDGRLEFESSERLVAGPSPGEPFRGFAIHDGDSLLARSEGMEAIPIPPALLDEADGGVAGSIGLADGRVLRLHVGRYPPRREVERGPSAPLVTVSVAEDEGPLAEGQARLSWLLVAGGSVVLLLSVAGGWFLARRIVGPISDVARAAGEIGSGDLSRRVPVRGSGDEVDRLAGALNDAFGRLEAAFERQARFTADAAHELRTPVAIIRTQAEVALRRERPPAEYRAALEEAVEGAVRIDETLEGLLLLARADAGSLVFEPEPVDLGDVAAEVLAAAAAEAGARSLDLALSVGDDCRVLGDRRQIRIALGNLVANAIRYSVGPARIEIRVSVAAGEVVVEVEDEGPGIGPDHLPRLFERFYRVDEARDRRDGGSGLGLSIVGSIVGRHGGRVAVRSEEGRGSTFSMAFPAAAT